MAVKKTTAQQTNTTRKTAVKKSTVKKPAAAKTAAKKSTAKKSVKTVTTDKPAEFNIYSDREPIMKSIKKWVHIL